MQRISGTMLLLTLLLSSCRSSVTVVRLPVEPEDNTARLVQHPQFLPAAQVAPEFVKEVFRVITRLEKEKAATGIP